MLAAHFHQPAPQLPLLPSLFCSCGAAGIAIKGKCQRCYRRERLSIERFGGARDKVLERDRYTCQGCGVPTNVVHHRRPGVHEDEWLITLCPSCHGLVEHLEVLDRYFPPLLCLLWRELHPTAPWQLMLPFVFATA